MIIEGIVIPSVNHLDLLLKRLKRVNAISIRKNTGLALKFSSPFVSLWTSIARRTEINDTQMGTEQKVTRKEAIKMYTLNGAYLTFEEDIKGSIEPDKLADMIIIDRDVMTCPEDEVKDTKVLTTYLGGKVVFEA